MGSKYSSGEVALSCKYYGHEHMLLESGIESFCGSSRYLFFSLFFFKQDLLQDWVAKHMIGATTGV